MYARNAVEKGSEADWVQSEPSSSPLLEKLIDREELAQVLGVSPSFISKLMAVEGLPYFKIGRAVRYELEQVKSWLLRRKMP